MTRNWDVKGELRNPATGNKIGEPIADERIEGEIARPTGLNSQLILFLPKTITYGDDSRTPTARTMAAGVYFHEGVWQ